MSGGVSDRGQDWHLEAFRQLQLTVLWACQESSARGFDEPSGKSVSPLGHEASEWPPGAGELYRDIAGGQLDKLAPTAEEHLRLANQVWEVFCTQDLRQGSRLNAAEFREVLVRSKNAVLRRRSEKQQTTHGSVPASPPPIVFAPDPRQLAASWVAQAYTYSQDSSFVRTPREQLSSSLQQEPRVPATIGAASLPEDCLERCAALEAQARQRLRLIKPIYIRWMRDPEEIQFLESVSQLLSSFIEQGGSASLDELTRAAPRRNGQDMVEAQGPHSIRDAIEELWQDAEPGWPPAALLDLERDLSPSENVLSGLLQRLTSDAGSASDLTGFQEPDEDFRSAFKRLPLDDRARLALVRAVVDEVEPVGSRPRNEQWFARVAEWSRSLLEGCACEAVFLLDEESAKAESACAIESSLEADESRIQKPGLVIRVGDSQAVAKQLVVVKPTKAGRFLSLLKGIESFLAKERKSSESFSNLLKSLTKSLKSAAQARHKSVAAWWEAGAGPARTQLWLLLQELRVLAAQVPGLEAWNSKVCQALEQEGFQFPGAPHGSLEDSFTHNGNRWILVFDSQDSGGQTTAHRGLALRGPDNRTLAPAVCFAASRSGPGEHLLQLSETLQQLLVRTDVEQAADWQPLYQTFAGALAVGNHALAIQPGLDLLTQTYRQAQDGLNSPPGVKSLRQQFCRAVYRCLVEICGVQVSPKLQGENLGLPQIKEWGSISNVNIEYESNDAAPGTILDVDRFTDGSVAAQWRVSCGRNSRNDMLFWTKLPPPPEFQSAPDALMNVLRHIHKQVVPWILKGESLGEKLSSQVEKVQAVCDGEGADWFHSLVSSAQAERHSPADSWLQVLLKGKISCYPQFDRKNRSASWPPGEAPGRELKFLPHDDFPPGMAIRVQRYATQPDRAQADISLGTVQPYFTRLQEIQNLWKGSQNWIAEYLTSKHLQALETATYLRAQSRSFPTAEQLIAPVLNGLVLASNSITEADLPRDEQLDRLRTLDQILQSVRQWGVQLRWRILPQQWVFAADVDQTELTPEELMTFSFEFGQRPTGICSLQKFGIAAPGEGDHPSIAAPCKGLVSAGPAPGHWHNLLESLKSKSVNAEASKDLRQRLHNLPLLKSKTSDDSVDWQNAGEKIFEAFYDMCAKAEISDEWRSSTTSRFERFMHEAFQLEVRHPSPADLAEEWVEANGNARNIILKEHRPALFGSDNYRLKAKVDTD